ncbi:snare associated golgi family protein [Nannochloropsis oceanica]
MPSIPLPTLSKKDGREYAAFDGGETNPHPPTLPPPHSPPDSPAHAQASGGDSSNGGSSGGRAAAADIESADLSTCPADTHGRHALSIGGGENPFWRIGGADEGLDRGRDGGRGRGCCWRMTRLQVFFVAVFGTCNLFLIADALGERRVLAWLEGVLINAHPHTTSVTTGLLLCLGFVLVFLGFPTTLLAVLAGTLLSGPLPLLVASLVVTLTSSLGCCLAFLVTRAILRDVASEVLYSHPRLAALDAVLAQNGLRFNLLLRLCPFLPFSLLNVGLGLTAIRTDDFALGTVVGMLPSVILLAYLGGAEGGGEGGVEGAVALLVQNHPVEARLVYVGGAVLLVGVGGMVWRGVRRVVREEEVRKQSVMDSLGWEM